MLVEFKVMATLISRREIQIRSENMLTWIKHRPVIVQSTVVPFYPSKIRIFTTFMSQILHGENRVHNIGSMIYSL